MTESKLTNEAGRFVTAAVRLTRWLRAMDPKPALTGAQSSALAVIVYAGTITPSRLAALEEVKRPTMTHTLAQLEALGAIKRKPSKQDGRSMEVLATAKGRALIYDGHARRIVPFADAIKRLSRKDQQTLLQAFPVLETLLDQEIGKNLRL